MNINGFEFPDPDHIGQAEYRALHDFLDDVMEETDGDEAAERAIDMLYEIEQWCRDLIPKLRLTKGAVR